MVAVCSKEAAERWPIFPGDYAKLLIWSFPYPSTFTGSDEQIMAQVRDDKGPCACTNSPLRLSGLCERRSENLMSEVADRAPALGRGVLIEWLSAGCLVFEVAVAVAAGVFSYSDGACGLRR